MSQVVIVVFIVFWYFVIKSGEQDAAWNPEEAA